MIRFSAGSKSYGENKQYIARIIGRDPKFTFNREFIGTKNGSTSSADVDDPGIYCEVDLDRKGRKEESYFFVADFAGELRKVRTDKEDAMVVAKRMDGGESFADIVGLEAEIGENGQPVMKDDGVTPRVVYEIKTKGEVKKASAAATVETAFAACWIAIQALPEKQAKLVLKMLKEKVSPPKIAPPATESIESAEVPAPEAGA